MPAPNILQRKIPFKSLVNDSAIKRGNYSNVEAGTGKGAIGYLRVVVLKPGGGTVEKGGTRWETKARRIKTRLGNRR